MNTRYAVAVQGRGVLPDDYPTLAEAEAEAGHRRHRRSDGSVRVQAVAYAYTPPEDDQ